MKGKMIPPITRRYRKRIEDLTLSDDIGFMRAFDGNTEGVEYLVRTLTGRDDTTVISAEAQKHLSSIDSHSVILDIFAEGKDGEQIDIEMQHYDGFREGLCSRMGRYMAFLQLGALGKGEGYAETRESIVLFISSRDPFGKGRDVYRFGTVDLDDGEREEGFMMSFYVANGSYRDTIGTERGRLLGDLSEKEIERMKSPMMRAALYRVKGDEMMLRDTYGMLYRIETENLEKGIRKGMEKGIEKGKAEEKEQIALRLIRKSVYPLSEIAELTELPIKEVERLAGSIRME